jgi:5-methylcytosine-specific restriction endonuclease McrA
MPRPCNVCTVCQHTEREIIDRFLLRGSAICGVARIFEISAGALRRHRIQHVGYVCDRCGQIKPRSEFGRVHGLMGCNCSVCVVEMSKCLENYQNQQRLDHALRVLAIHEWCRVWDEKQKAALALIPAKIRRRRLAQVAIKKLKPAIVRRDGWICAICGEFVQYDDLSIDHMVPISRGGRDDKKNLQVAHRRCNSRKGARLAS